MFLLKTKEGHLLLQCIGGGTFFARCSLLITFCSLLFACCLLLFARYIMLRCSLLFAGCSLLFTRCSKRNSEVFFFSKSKQKVLYINLYKKFNFVNNLKTRTVLNFLDFQKAVLKNSFSKN